MLKSLQGKGVRVPSGFATTARAYREYLELNELESVLKKQIDRLDGEGSLESVGRAIRKAFQRGQFPGEVSEAIRGAYRKLSKRNEPEDVDVAVRSSATAEDLPEASFAGQQETFLNLSGEDDLLGRAATALPRSSPIARSLSARSTASTTGGSPSREWRRFSSPTSTNEAPATGAS